MTEEDFEVAQRELCPDGACIGLIGPDGRCKVCGAVGVSQVADPRHRGLRATNGESGPSDTSDTTGDPDELDADRELCPDGACVGLIGPDGQCSVCGTKASDAPPDASPEEESKSGSPSDSADFDEDRELCPDGSCVGLIGPDGRCKVCGTARPSPAS